MFGVFTIGENPLPLGQTVSGIEIPVNITGPWDNPDISPDIAGALNSESTVEAVKSIGKNFEGKDAGEIVDDLFGKGNIRSILRGEPVGTLVS